MTFKLVGIGEVLWDLLHDGPKLGGAPANFAYQARALGATSQIVSRVGDDSLGREALQRLATLAMPIDCVEVDPNAPTGTAAVELGADGQPHFVIHENVAWDNLQGSANQPSVSVDRRRCMFWHARSAQPSVRNHDSRVGGGIGPFRPAHLRHQPAQHFYSRQVIEASLALANVLKVNETELPILREMFALPGDERQQIAALAETYRLRAVAYTRGGQGSMLLANGRWSAHPGIPAQVVDTVGAGDAFTAAMTIGLCAGWDLDLINHRANTVASFVASSAGATPVLPEPLRSPFLAVLHALHNNGSPE